MIGVTIYSKSAIEVINIVHELKALGLTQGTDFEFSYHAAEIDYFSNDPGVYSKHTIFKFADPSTATWFRLKYEISQ